MLVTCMLSLDFLQMLTFVFTTEIYVHPPKKRKRVQLIAAQVHHPARMLAPRPQGCLRTRLHGAGKMIGLGFLLL